MERVSHSHEIMDFHVKWCKTRNSGNIRAMSTSHSTALIDRLHRSLAEQYGQVVGGADLANLLGFRSTDTLRKAISNKSLTLKTFVIPGRQGRFALTAEVADWLIALRDSTDAAAESNGH
jgi:hypothetical protein